MPQALSPSSRGDSIFRTRLTLLEPRPAFPLLQSFSGLPALCPLGSAFCLRVPALILFCPLAVHQQDLCPSLSCSHAANLKVLGLPLSCPQALHSTVLTQDCPLPSCLRPAATHHCTPFAPPTLATSVHTLCTAVYSVLFNELGLWQYFGGYS